jgi:membrane protease YdiL (CAAX protease family)
LESGESLKRQLWGPWATAGFGLVVGIIFLITQTLVVVAFAVAKFVSDATFSLSGFAEALASNGLLLALATIASSVVCSGLVIIIVKVRRSATIADYLGLRWITGKTVLVLLAIAVGFVVLSGWLSTLLGKPSDAEFMVDAYRTSVWPALFWVAVVILGPVFEETFFRGFLFVGFLQSRLGPAGTIFLTSFIWALLHIQYSAYGVVTIVIMGIILGLMRLKTDSLWSPLILHVLNNLVSTLETALYVNGILS